MVCAVSALVYNGAPLNFPLETKYAGRLIINSEILAQRSVSIDTVFAIIFQFGFFSASLT